MLNQEAEVGPQKENKFSVGVCEGGRKKASVYKLKKKEKKKNYSLGSAKLLK